MNGVQGHELPHLDQSRLQHAIVLGLPVDAESLLVTFHFSGREGQVWDRLFFSTCLRRERNDEKWLTLTHRLKARKKVTAWALAFYAIAWLVFSRRGSVCGVTPHMKRPGVTSATRS